MEETLSTTTADQLRRLEERLDALDRALRLLPFRDETAGGDAGGALLAEADAHLAVASRVAALLDEKRSTWDGMDHTTAAVMLKDLAQACRALRRTAALAGGRLKDADAVIRRLHGELDKFADEDGGPDSVGS